MTMYLSRLKRSAVFLIPLAIAFIFIGKTRIVSGWGEWYSESLSHRFQTEALLEGELRIQSSPITPIHDWVWNKGMHQQWGMGVPLLRLPFEALAFFRIEGFPDRLVFLFYYILIAITVFSTPILGTDLSSRTLAAALLLLQPPLIAMCGTYFRVYEEVVAYGCLFSVLSYALLIRCLQQPTPLRYFVLCFISGFLILIRPTLLVYGFFAAALGCLHFLKNSGRKKLAAVGAGLFGIGPAATAIFNALRFGNPFDFGANTQLNASDWAAIMVRLERERLVAPLWPRVKEMFLGMFHPEAFETNRSGSMIFIDFYFRHFDFAMLGLFVVGAVLSLRSTRKEIRLGALWALLAFCGLFAFYLNFIAQTSRYYVDFSSALFAPMLGIVAFLIPLLQSKLGERKTMSLKLAIVSAAVAWGALQKVNRSDTPLNAEAVREKMIQHLSRSHAAALVLPSSYDCGDADFHRGITYNAIGWEGAGACSVGASTTLFFSDPQCLEFRAESNAPNADPASFFSSSRVFVGKAEWVPIAEHRENQSVLKTYCPAPEDSTRYNGLQLAFISWIPMKDLGKKTSAVRLLHARNVPRP